MGIWGLCAVKSNKGFKIFLILYLFLRHRVPKSPFKRPCAVPCGTESFCRHRVFSAARGTWLPPCLRACLPPSPPAAGLAGWLAGWLAQNYISYLNSQKLRWQANFLRWQANFWGDRQIFTENVTFWSKKVTFWSRKVVFFEKKWLFWQKSDIFESNKKWLFFPKKGTFVVKKWLFGKKKWSFFRESEFLETWVFFWTSELSLFWRQKSDFLAKKVTFWYDTRILINF